MRTFATIARSCLTLTSLLLDPHNTKRAASLAGGPDRRQLIQCNRLFASQAHCYLNHSYPTAEVGAGGPGIAARLASAGAFRQGRPSPAAQPSNDHRPASKWRPRVSALADHVRRRNSGRKWPNEEITSIAFVDLACVGLFPACGPSSGGPSVSGGSDDRRQDLQGARDPLAVRGRRDAVPQPAQLHEGHGRRLVRMDRPSKRSPQTVPPSPPSSWLCDHCGPDRPAQRRRFRAPLTSASVRRFTSAVGLSTVQAIAEVSDMSASTASARTSVRSGLDRECLARQLPKQIQPSQTRADQTSRKLRQARGSLCKPPKHRG